MQARKKSRAIKNKKSIRRRRLIIDRFYKKSYTANEKLEFISISDTKNNVLHTYKVDERIRNMKSLQDKKSNEKALRNYFQKRSRKKYNPVTREDLKKETESFTNKNKLSKKVDRETETIFLTQHSRLISTRKQHRIKRYDYMYIRVKVKIFFDGFYVIAFGRSDYFYRHPHYVLQKKGYKSFVNGISPMHEKYAIEQAIQRALAPYGSNLDFKLLDWKYVYHQNIDQW